MVSDDARRHLLDRADRLLRGFGLRPRLVPEDTVEFDVPFQGRINQD